MIGRTLTRAELVDRVVAGLVRQEPISFLLEVPPGCNYPDLIRHVLAQYDRRRPLDHRVAFLTADAHDGERELVREMVRQWTAKDPELERTWDREASLLGQDTPPQELFAFAQCVRRARLRLVLLIGKFDRLFRLMSGGLLASLRELEHESLLASVNVSPLPYNDLYLRRSRETPGFTSDYGQVHVRLTIGRLDQETARDLWSRKVDATPKGGSSEAYFRIALSESGGLPSAFELGMRLAPAIDEKLENLPNYRLELRRQVPSSYARLLQYDGPEASNLVIDALARLQLGIQTSADLATIQAHRWKGLFVEQDPAGGLVLVCDALGRKALELCRSARGRHSAPDQLYRQGQFPACCEELRTGSHVALPALRPAAEMMAEVFGYSPRNLYFEPAVRWQRVADLAQQGAKACRDETARQEFEGWARVAAVHLRLPRPDRAQVEEYLEELRRRGREALSDAMIYLAIRVLAVKRDAHALTAGHVALPLVEDILRHYIMLVLDCRPRGEAFTTVNETLVAEWWGNTSFSTPPAEARLTGASLALLVAAASDARHARLFSDATELRRVLSVMELTRNLLSHYVVNPGDRQVKQLIGWAELLLDRTCLHLACGVSLGSVERLLQPPRRFLDS